MHHRLAVLLNIYLLLWVVLFGVATSVQASDSAPEERKESITRVEKTSSNNIHVDEIVFKNIPSAQSGNTTITDDDRNKLVATISHEAKEKTLDWLFYGVIALFMVIGTAIWAFISRIIENKIQKLVDPHIVSLDKQKIDLVTSAAKIATEGNVEIEKTKVALEDLQKKESQIKQQLNDFDNEIGLTEKNVSDLKLNLISINEEFESKSTDEIFRLEQKIRALYQIIDNLDANKSASESAVDKLIIDLGGSNKELKYNAAELLPYFKLGTDKIADAFITILSDNPDFTLESLLLSGLSELKGNSNVMNYLVRELGDLGNPNILAIIGALGKISVSE